MKYILFIALSLGGLSQCVHNAMAAEKAPRRPHKTELVANIETGARVKCMIEATDLKELIDLNQSLTTSLSKIGNIDEQDDND